MSQLQSANLTLKGWAHQECVRLMCAGRSHRSVRRMEATTDSEPKNLSMRNGGYAPLGLGLSIDIRIHLEVCEGDKPLTEDEVVEVKEFLTKRYPKTCIGKTDRGRFWIEWNNRQAYIGI